MKVGAVRSWSFAKGHGTRNDFVVVLDRHGMLHPSPADVSHLCDRRVGVGADGFLRAIKASHMPGWDGDPDLWFMDSRNADGSPGIVGGNGLRVFVRYLRDGGLLDGDDVQVATRLGTRRARVLPDGRIATEAGPILVRDDELTVRTGERRHPGVGIEVDVAHAVCHVDAPPAELDFALVEVLGRAGVKAPGWDNACFWVEVAPGRVVLRHWQRGIGQSVSCGTGAVATARAYLREQGASAGHTVVDVTGGWLEVEIDEDGQGMLYGPARITARGEVHFPEA